MGQAGSEPHERGTEIRLALVMNGGVSLAVWMGGVAHELDLLRRASDPGVAREDVAERDRPVFDLWRELTEQADKRVQIDIVSGTSAGGLNGLFLATAIARGTGLPDLRRMWESSASLDKLVNPAKKDRLGLRGRRAQNSVLNGRFFEEQIGEALRTIRRGSAGQEQVTLFVTATALDGRSRPFKDSYGQTFDVRDHRRVYRFEKHPNPLTYTKAGDQWEVRPGASRDHFTDDADLRLAARATAGFPVAFEPVSEFDLLSRRKLPDPAYGYPASSVMDGGVLSNEPFGPVLEAITKRKLKGAVQRVLVYIVPSGGQLADEKAKDLRAQDVPWSTTLWSAVSYPQEANFRASMEELDHRLQTSGGFARDALFERLAHSAAAHRTAGRGARGDDALGRQVEAAATSLLDEYRRSRVMALLLAVRPQRARTETATTLTAPPEADAAAVDALLAEQDWQWCPPAEAAQPGTADGQEYRRWRWGLAAAQRLLQTFGNHLQRRLAEGAGPGGAGAGPGRRSALADAVQVIDEQFRGVLAISQEVLASEDRRRPADTGLSEEQAARLADGVFRDLDVPSQVGGRVWRAAESFVGALEASGADTGWTPQEAISVCLRVEILTQAFAPPAKALSKLTPRFTFLRLGPDSLGPLFNEDWSEGRGDRKLYGIRLRHFGAFVSGGWRASDFAWGRLDAAHHLVPLLVDAGATAAWETKLHQAVLVSETGLPAAEAVELMRRRLTELTEHNDAELLDDAQAATLKSAGDALIRVVTRRQGLLIRRAAFCLWAYAWEAWRQGHSPPKPATLLPMARRALRARLRARAATPAGGATPARAATPAGGGLRPLHDPGAAGAENPAEEA